jgi:hypothetical protein
MAFLGAREKLVFFSQNCFEEVGVSLPLIMNVSISF